MRSAILKRSVLLAVLAVSACKEKEPAKPDKADKPEKTPLDDGEEHTDIRSVYPATVKPEPVAEKVCDALHQQPKQRHAECCKESLGVVFTGECVRVLSAAIQSKAVKVDPAVADLCAAETKKSLEGCDWVGIWPPSIPKSCLHLVEGALAKGERCRSALECKPGLQCAGLDPVRAGRCADPGDRGAPCGGTTDPLAVYTSQLEFEEDHPVCAGFCDRTRCAAPSKEGEPCKSDFPCGRGAHCGDGKCVKGRSAAVGEGCTAGGCAYGARCVQFKCVAPKANGASCSEDSECFGGCNGGVCKPTCDRIAGTQHIRTVLTSSPAQH